MKIKCIWEHNNDGGILYIENYTGAFTRGNSLENAVSKIPREINSYLSWLRKPIPETLEYEIVQEKVSALDVKDADSDVIFESERCPLTFEEYKTLKDLALKSAADFYTVYQSVPDKNKSCLPERGTFYGKRPRTAEEMYIHTKNVNDYYFGEIGIETDNEGTILECRQKSFLLLEKQPDYLNDAVYADKDELSGYSEEWSLRKVLRRFVWHDRIHAKAMLRMAIKTFGSDEVLDVFRFNP